MLNVVWAAVIVAVAFFAAGVSAAIYLMIKTARLIGVTTATVTGLHEQSDLLMQHASAAVARANEQTARAEAITASMDGVTSAMTDLGERLAVLAPAARTVADGIGTPVTRAAAVVYGVNRALRLRRGQRAQVAARPPARAALTGEYRAVAWRLGRRARSGEYRARSGEH